MGENKRIGEHAQTGADKRSGERLEDLDYRERGGVMCTWCSWSKWKRISYFIFTGGWWLVCSCEELEKIAAKVEDVEGMAEVIAKERFREGYEKGDGYLVIDDARAVSAWAKEG